MGRLFSWACVIQERGFIYKEQNNVNQTYQGRRETDYSN